MCAADMHQAHGAVQLPEPFQPLQAGAPASAEGALWHCCDGYHLTHHCYIPVVPPQQRPHLADESQTKMVSRCVQHAVTPL